jgi:hypothetical protein
MKLVKEVYSPGDKQANVRGQSMYRPFIDQLMQVKPGTAAIECANHKLAKGLVHALSRHLHQTGKISKLRPALRKDSDTSSKVWLLPKDAT